VNIFMMDQNSMQGQAPSQDVNPKKLFVGNLSWNLASEDLRELFSEFGTVEDAIVLTDKFTHRSKGFGFVTMSTAEEAQAAIDGLNEKEIDGRQIVVNVAQPPRPREDRRFGGGGDRGGRNDRRPGGGGSFRSRPPQRRDY
jgi:cold-inducible RNA-binding protein